MDARHMFPVHADYGARIRSLRLDLQRAKVNLATGRLAPAHYAPLARVLEERLLELETEAQTRLAATLVGRSRNN